MTELQSLIREIPDFPKKGILFKDITPLLKNPQAFQEVIQLFIDNLRDLPFNTIAAIESRGFIFGSALALAMEKKLVPIRKKGKLPAAVHRVEYDLEYGKDILEVHQDAMGTGDQVLIIDDLLATGGTVVAVEQLIALSGASITAACFLIELTFLGGREHLSSPQIISLIQY